MKITICGGGNLGHACAAWLSARAEADVTMFTRHPGRWDKEIKCFMPDGSTLEGHLASITDSPREAVSGAELVLLCLPGFAIKEGLEGLKDFLHPSTKLGGIVSSTGFFFFAHETLPATQPLFGFQRVPFICRIGEYGRSVHLKGGKKHLSVALENIEDNFCSTLEGLFACPVERLDNFYEASLTNSNPLLHTSRLYTMWSGWDGKPFESAPLFYEDWTMEASRLYLEMDGEFQELLRSLGIRNGAIPPVLDYYECTDAKSLTCKLRGIEAFKSLPSPMKQVPGGFVPDFASRYFTEDFPYGLRFAWQLAHERSVPCPCIDEVYKWGMEKI